MEVRLAVFEAPSGGASLPCQPWRLSIDEVDRKLTEIDMIENVDSGRVFGRFRLFALAPGDVVL